MDYSKPIKTIYWQTPFIPISTGSLFTLIMYFIYIYDGGAVCFQARVSNFEKFAWNGHTQKVKGPVVLILTFFPYALEIQFSILVPTRTCVTSFAFIGLAPWNFVCVALFVLLASILKTHHRLYHAAHDHFSTYHHHHILTFHNCLGEC